MSHDNNNITGIITSIRGLIVTVSLTGDKPDIKTLLALEKDNSVLLELDEFLDETTAVCINLTGSNKLTKGDKVLDTGQSVTVGVGDSVLGRMFNALGEPIDGKGEVKDAKRINIYKTPIPSKDINVSKKEREIVVTGIKVVDFLAPFVKGSKIGIAGGAGVGKTVVLTEIIHNTSKKGAAVPMFAGIGERVREGQELYHTLQEKKLLDETLLFMGQMNENAAMRVLVGQSAAAAAQYFRDEEKKDVLFFVDNIYRFIQAGTELSTVVGELPSEGAYQPTIYSDIRHVLGRLYSNKNGSVTTVLAIYIPADDITDPAVQEIQQQLDSVIVLSREVEEMGIHPAVDILRTRSSMVTPEIVGDRHYRLVSEVQHIIQQYESLRTIVSIIGESELSEKDRLNYRKAQTVVQYFNQDAHVVEDITGVPGRFFTREETLKGIEEILNVKTINELKQINDSLQKEQ